MKLVQDKAFSPRPIKRELRSILNLLEKKNLEGFNYTTDIGELGRLD